MTTIQDQLDRLAQSDRLTVAQALDRAKQIAGQVEQAAKILEEGGEFERAAYLYDQAARAFEMAADRVPGPDREQVAALGELWSVKADVTRYRVFTAPPVAAAEQSTEAVQSTGVPTDPATGPPTSPRVRPPTGPLEKPVETQDEPWTRATPAPARGGSTPPTAIKKPDHARDGQWSIAQTPSPVDEPGSPGAILKKLNKARKKSAGKEHESPYER